MEIRIYGEDSPLSGGTKYESPLSGSSLYFDDIFSSSLNGLTGLTVSGIISATTISGGTIYGNASNLTNVVTSISTSTGISADTSSGSVTLLNTLPDQTVTITPGSNITVTGTYPNFTISSSGGGGGGGSSRTTSTVTTTNDAITTLGTITGITDNETSYIEVYVKSYQSSATNWGVWKRTLSVTKVSGTVTIREENADVDKQSTGLSSNSLSFSVSGGDILIRVTGIASTTINWKSAYEIIL